MATQSGLRQVSATSAHQDANDTEAFTPGDPRCLRITGSSKIISKLSCRNASSIPRRKARRSTSWPQTVQLPKCPTLSKGVSTMRAQNVMPFDVSRLEDDVQEAVQQRHSHIQAVDYVPRPVPEYVVHRDDVSEIGKLS